MASITINPVSSKVSEITGVTGTEKLIAINKDGKPSTIAVNQILEKIDDGIVDRIDDQILDKVEDQIDEAVDERLDNVEFKLKWNEVI